MTPTSVGAQPAAGKLAPTPGPMLDLGIVNYGAPDFALSLVRSSHGVVRVRLAGVELNPGC
jgi:hypothetical protein